LRGYVRQKGKDKHTWQIQLYTGVSADGKYRRHYETFHGKKSDAQNRLNELLVSYANGTFAVTGRLTVAEHLKNWLEGYVKTNCTLRTLEGYKSIIDRHLTPALGHLQLKNLKVRDIQRYYGKACQNLSARTVHHHHRVLFQSLKYAVKQGDLGLNPAERVDPPTPRKKTMRTLTPSEVEHLLNVAQRSSYYPIYYTAVSSGLRQAELLGLRWRDIDLDLCSISVSQVLYMRHGRCYFTQPKTEHSRRQVSMTPKLVIFLREYKKCRELLYLDMERILSLDDLVFTSITLEPLGASVLSHDFNRIVKRAGLPGVRFHDLRHTFASLMLLRGAKPKVISEALGHSSVAFTMDVYSHIIEGMQSDAMALL